MLFADWQPEAAMAMVAYVEKNLLSNIKPTDGSGKEEGATKESKDAKESKETEALRLKIDYVRKS